MIPVTKPYLPAQEKYIEFIDSIYNRVWLTNNGPLVNELEIKIGEYLETERPLFLGNGTVALQIAIKALELKGDIITTPFSYVATTSSIVWENCNPVFVDIDPDTLNIDSTKIKASITEKTTAILATHCFGNACNIEAINLLAEQYNLKVIYDAAHCFGTKYNGRSVFEYGDISTCSLHATKLMHSVEGGLIFAHDLKLMERFSYMRNFGHDGPARFNGVGINGKNSEFHAAMGLCVLEDIETILIKRKSQSTFYDDLLDGLPIKKLKIEKGCYYNYAYFPILLESEKQTIRVIDALNKNDIHPRRYFYPSLSSLEYIQSPSETPVSDDCAARIICLPLYHNLKEEEQELICKIIKSTI